jgi:hypothetical protein
MKMALGLRTDNVSRPFSAGDMTLVHWKGYRGFITSLNQMLIAIWHWLGVLTVNDCASINLKLLTSADLSENS